MKPMRLSVHTALLMSLIVHLVFASAWLAHLPSRKPEPQNKDNALQLTLVAAPAKPAQALAPKQTQATAFSTQPQPTLSAPHKAPASMDAPSAPTAEEWQAAATYTPKNSKRYRYTWGQQVRSMMGTAVEGPDQGLVRFRIEIAANGTIAHVELLWTTSLEAEKRARQAIANLPPLPPTPTGKALVFEQTISFEPFESGWPPIYKYDCLPDPPAFKNPFVWDGKSPQTPSAQGPQHISHWHTSKAVEGCENLDKPDSAEAESMHDTRQIYEGSSSRLKD
jgi:hypothetical protein